MADYKKLYHKLFNKISDIIDELKLVQQEAEGEYISQDEKENIIVIDKFKDNE